MEHAHTVERRSTNSSADLCNFAEAGSVEDDEERDKRQRRMDGWQPDRGTEWNASEAYQSAHLQSEMVNACDSDTQLCGQASDETRVELSDGGCIYVDNGCLRSCVGDHVPFVELVKTKRSGQSNIEAIW